MASCKNSHLLRFSFIFVLLVVFVIWSDVTFADNVDEVQESYDENEIKIEESDENVELAKQMQSLRGEVEILLHEKKNMVERITNLENRVQKLENKSSDESLKDSTEEETYNSKSALQNTHDSEDSPTKQYQTAYTMLHNCITNNSKDKNILNTEYQKASEAFKKFVVKYPRHSLSTNAYYWLGQIEADRGNYADAAENYLNSYKLEPRGARAQDSLLHLAEALFKNNKQQTACMTLKKLQVEFPIIKTNIKNNINILSKNMRCMK